MVSSSGDGAICFSIALTDFNKISRMIATSEINLKINQLLLRLFQAPPLRLVGTIKSQVCIHLFGPVDFLTRSIKQISVILVS